MSRYGIIIVTSIIALILMGYFFSSSYADGFVTPEAGYAANDSAGKTQNAMNRQLPTVIFGMDRMDGGIIYDLTDKTAMKITAMDSEGNALDLKVAKIIKSDGTEVTGYDPKAFLPNSADGSYKVFYDVTDTIDDSQRTTQYSNLFLVIRSAAEETEETFIDDDPNENENETVEVVETEAPPFAEVPEGSPCTYTVNTWVIKQNGDHTATNDLNYDLYKVETYTTLSGTLIAPRPFAIQGYVMPETQTVLIKSNGIVVNYYVWSVSSNTSTDAAYAILYNTGELVFQRGDTKDNSKGSIVDIYTGFETASYQSDPKSVPWYNNRSAIRTVTVKNTIKPVSAAYWFAGCGNLTEINNLWKLDVSKASSLAYMFSDCASLASIDLSSFKTGSITDMSHMFDGCSKMQSIDIDVLDTSSVQYMDGLLRNCSTLTNVSLKEFDTSSAIRMNQMFENCQKLVNIDLSAFNTNSAQYMQNMFAGCVSLASIDLTRFNTSKVVDMSSIFNGCLVLDSITLGKYFKFTGAYESVSGLLGSWTSAERGLIYSSQTLWETYKGSTMSGTYVHEAAYALLYNNGDLVFQRGDQADASKGSVAASYSGFETDVYTSAANVPWAGNVSAIRNVIFKDEMQPISTANWFNGCRYMSTIKNSYNLQMDLVTDTSNMFNKCLSMSQLDVSIWNVSHVEKMDSMFANCGALTQLDLSTWKTSAVTSMASMFSGCLSLTELKAAAWETDAVTNMSAMFNSCSSLRVLDVEQWHTGAVISMKNMFTGCEALEQLNTTAWDTANVTTMASMFNGCELLSQLNTAGWHTEKVQDMKLMFEDCTSLTQINVSAWNTANVLSMQSMFENCSVLGELDLSNWNTQKVTNMNVIFGDCVSLRTIKLGADFRFAGAYADAALTGYWKSVERGNFYSAEELWTNYNGATMAGTYVWYVPAYAILYDSGEMVFQRGSKANSEMGTVVGSYMGFETATYTRYKQVPWCANRTSIKTVTFEDEMQPIATAYWFYGCSNLTAVNDTNKVDMSTAKNMTSMFKSCSALTSLDVSSWNTGAVEDMASMFSSCSALTSLDVSSWNTSAVKDMSSMFSSCSALTSLDVSSWNTGAVNKLALMFGDCRVLANLDVSNWNVSSVTNMSELFKNCTSLTAIDVSKWHTDKVQDMSSVFSGCSLLTTIDVSNWNTNTVTDMHDIFDRCSSLTTLDVSKWQTSTVIFMNRMFGSCSSLTTLDVSNWQTDAAGRMTDMFNGCKALASLDMSNWDTTKVIDMTCMFDSCSSLSTIKLGANFKFIGTKHYLKGSTGYWQSVTTEDVYSSSELWTTYSGSTMAGTYVAYTPAYALLYSSGEMVFQRGSSKDASKGSVTATYTGFETVKTADESLWIDQASLIKTVTFKDEVKPNLTVNWFKDCTNLTAVNNTKNLNVSNVTDMSSMFYNCTSLATLDVSSWQTSKVTNMSSMFTLCSSLETIELGTNFKFIGTTSYIDGKTGYWKAVATGKTYTATDLWTTYDGATMAGTYVSFTPVEAPAEAYAIIYDSGEMVFQRGSVADTAKGTVVATYTGFEDTAYENVSAVSWLENKTLVKTVTFKDEINPISTAQWFNGFTNLTTVNAADKLNTDNVTDMIGMFYNCGLLTSINVSDWNTEKVTRMFGMFESCRSLTNLDVSRWDTSAVTDMREMFYICTSLTSLDVSKWQTGSVKSMNSMFYRCMSLTNLDVSDWQTGNVTSMAQTFNGCTSLATLDVSSWQTENVVNMYHMFQSCSRLTTLDLSNWNTAKVTDMTNILTNCSSLSTLNLGTAFKFVGTTSYLAGATDYWQSVEQKYVYSSSELWSTYSSTMSGTYVAIPTPAYAILYDTGEMVFQRGNEVDTSKGSVTAIYTGFENETYTDSFKAPWFENRALIKTVTFKDEIQPLSTAFWFVYCSNMTTVNGADKLDTSNVTDMSYMFDFCGSLTTIDVSKWQTDSVINTKQMFFDCSSLTALDVSGWNTAKVKNMNSMFYNCSKLTTLNVSKWQTGVVTDMGYIFYCCKSLQDINVSNWNTGNVTDMSYALSICPALTSVDVSTWNTKNVTNMKGMFYASKGLTTLDVSNWNTAKVIDMSSLFENCSSLANIDVINWNTSSVTNMNGIFYNCSSIEYLTLGKNFKFVGAYSTSNLSGSWRLKYTSTIYTAEELWTTYNGATMSGSYSTDLINIEDEETPL